jgi:hypothetical protein
MHPGVFAVFHLFKKSLNNSAVTLIVLNTYLGAYTFVMIDTIVWFPISARILLPLLSSLSRDSPFWMNLYDIYSKSFCIDCAMIDMVLPASFADADLRSRT